MGFAFSVFHWQSRLVVAVDPAFVPRLPAIPGESKTVCGIEQEQDGDI